jgi:hypothetical protein
MRRLLSRQPHRTRSRAGEPGQRCSPISCFSKYGLHLPLNRQSAVYARQDIDREVSTPADWVGAAAATLMPLVGTIRGHVFAAERIHTDDTTAPVLTKDKTRTGRLWTYVRDSRAQALRLLGVFHQTLVLGRYYSLLFVGV